MHKGKSFIFKDGLMSFEINITMVKNKRELKS